MISGFTLIPFFCTSAAASKTARACISVISGIDNAEPAAAMAEHRVEFVQFVHALRDLVRADADLVRQRALRGVIVRQEFMQRRIEKTNRRRKTFERFENADEIARVDTAAISPALFSDRPTLSRQDHFAHGVDAIAFEKHVFGAAKTDAAGAKRDRVFRLLGRIGVGAHTHARDLRAPIHQLIEIAIRLGLLRDLVAMEQSLNDFRWGGSAIAGVNRPARPVDRKVIVAFAETRCRLPTSFSRGNRCSAPRRRRYKLCPSAARPAPRAN